MADRATFYTVNRNQPVTLLHQHVYLYNNRIVETNFNSIIVSTFKEVTSSCMEAIFVCVAVAFDVGTYKCQNCVGGIYFHSGYKIFSTKWSDRRDLVRPPQIDEVTTFQKVPSN